MTDKDQNSGADQTSDEVTVETTSVFRADFLNELDAPASAGTEGAVSGVEGLPVGRRCLSSSAGPTRGRASCSTSPPRRRVAIPTATSSSTTSR